MEKIMQTTDDDTVDMTVINEIAAVANIPLGNVRMTTRLYCMQRSNGAIVEKVFTDDCNPPTEWESRYIEITVRDEYTPIFPITFGANAAGRYPINVKVGMRTR
jgi:hypothetical protein